MYRLISGAYSLEGETYLSFGIQYGNIMIEDISMEQAEVEGLIALCNQEKLDVLQLLISSMFGIFGVAAGLEGYFIRPMNWALRLLSVLGGISLIYPGTMTDIMGIVIIVVVFSIQTLQNSRDPESLSSP